VDPKVMVEVQYADIQKSSLYSDGVTLHFARIARLRDDKAPGEADTIQHMRLLLKRQRAGVDAS
jgi:DNA ligase-1